MCACVYELRKGENKASARQLRWPKVDDIISQRRLSINHHCSVRGINIVSRNTSSRHYKRKLTCRVQHLRKKKKVKKSHFFVYRVRRHDVPLWWWRLRITSSFERTSITALKPWNCSRSRASARATPDLSLGSQTIGGGAMSSGANNILDISSAWSANGRGGRRGGASGCVRAARSVAVRSSSVSVGIGTGPCC